MEHFIDIVSSPYFQSMSAADQEGCLRLLLFRLCGSSELVQKIIPEGVALALKGEARFAEESGLTPEEHAARLRLIPGHNLAVYRECLSACGGQRE